jgi:hypothetical protein
MSGENPLPEKEAGKVLLEKFERDEVKQVELPSQQKEKKKQKSSKKTVLTKLRRIAILRNQEMVIVEDHDTGIGYIAPFDTKFVRGWVELNVKELELAYDWTDEIENMLPSREEMVAHIRRSIWKSGGSEKGRGSKGHRLNNAWPYHLREEE